MKALISLMFLIALSGCDGRHNGEAEREFNLLLTSLEDDNLIVERRDPQGRWALDSVTRTHIAKRLVDSKRKLVSGYFTKILIRARIYCITPTNQINLDLCDGGIIMCNEQQFYVGDECVSNLIAVSQEGNKK